MCKSSSSLLRIRFTSRCATICYPVNSCATVTITPRTRLLYPRTSEDSCRGSLGGSWRLQRGKHGSGIRYVPHRLAVPGSADNPLSVDDDHRRHAAKLHKFDLLAKACREPMLGIGDNREGELLTFPIAPNRTRPIGSDDDDLCSDFTELFIVSAQLRQMPAAVWSAEPAQQHKHGGVTAQGRAADRVSLSGRSNPLRSSLADSKSRHVRPPPGSHVRRR